MSGTKIKIFEGRSVNLSRLSSAQLFELERDYEAILLEDERVACENDFKTFVIHAWKAIESVEFEESWAIDALCKHLQAVTEGYIKRLLVNYPPRCAKSNVTSIMWPAWTWVRSQISYTSGPQVQFLTASYNDELSLEFANKMRMLINSPWFQRHWGHRFKLKSDQNAKSHFVNSAHGGRQSTSVGGGLIGKGGAINIADDLHNTKEAESEADRATTHNFWREFSTTRLNHPKKSAIVAIMQRVHEEDVSGIILANDPDEQWVYLMIPMEYDPDRHCVTGWLVEGNIFTWEDPRSIRGELMWPERFGLEKLRADARALGPYMYSGRYQQLPTPEGGGIIKKAWWQPWEASEWPVFDYLLASLDTAHTEKQENDPSAMTVWGIYTDENGRQRIMVVDAWEDHLLLHDLAAKVAKTCKSFKVDRLLVEAKANGREVAQELRREHSRQLWSVEEINPGSSDKRARVHSVVPLFADGVITAPVDRDWCAALIKQCAEFPKAKHDDLVDSTTQALRYLRSIGLAELGEEIQAQHVDSLKWRSPKSMRIPYDA